MDSPNRPCDEWVTPISLYADGEHDRPEEVEDHLDHCERCRRWLDLVEQDRARVLQAFALPVPTCFAERVVAGAQAPALPAPRRSVGNARFHRALELGAAAALIALLVGLVSPLLPVARATSRAQTCLSNVREVSSAMRVYASDHADVLPPGRSWDRSLASYVRGLGSYQCPEAGTLPSYCFEPRAQGARLASFLAPSQTVLLFDESEHHSGFFDPRHNGNGTTGFLDGGAKLLPSLPYLPEAPGVDAPGPVDPAVTPLPRTNDQRAMRENGPGWRV